MKSTLKIMALFVVFLTAVFMTSCSKDSDDTSFWFQFGAKSCACTTYGATYEYTLEELQNAYGNEVHSCSDVADVTYDIMVCVDANTPTWLHK